MSEDEALVVQPAHQATQQEFQQVQDVVGITYRAEGSGVPILRALQTSRDTLSNVAMREQVEEAANSVREGIGLARALSAHKHFPPMLIHMIRAGEVTGELPAMLERASNAQEQDLERRALTMAGLLEPALILAMGVVVLLIVLAVLMPIIEINQLVR